MTQKMPRIMGIGTAEPEQAVTQAEAAALAQSLGGHTERRAKELGLLYQRTRIRKRGSVVLESSNGEGVRQSLFRPSRNPGDRGPTTGERVDRYAQEAPALAGRASDAALQQAGVSREAITHLVTVSCTGFSAPGVDIRLIKTLGLPAGTERTHIGFMGCHGAMNGLRVAAALAAAHPKARVLLCAVELCSLHFQYGWSSQSVVSNALFADGAAACVVGVSESGEGLAVAATASLILPDSEEAMGWRIGDHGFEMTLDPSVPQRIGRHLRPWLESWLASQRLSLGEIGSWALHPGGPRVLAGVAEGLGLPSEAAEASRHVLAEHGNMSSPTILFILDRLGRLQAAKPYLALAFGPGLAAEASLLR